VAVNAWYDMASWGTGYAHYKLVEALAADAGLMPAPPEDSGSGSGDDCVDGGSRTSEDDGGGTGASVQTQ
jgi:hypothetical protein